MSKCREGETVEASGWEEGPVPGPDVLVSVCTFVFNSKPILSCHVAIYI